MDSLPWSVIADYLIRLLPGGLIISAAIVAKKQLNAGRRATKITLARAHFREFLAQCLSNADIAHGGVTSQSLAAIRRDDAAYRRYRWLVSIALISLEELYFALPDDKHVRMSIATLASAFKYSILSDIELPPRQRAGRRPEFMRFLEAELKTFEHPIVAAQPRLHDGAVRIAPVMEPLDLQQRAPWRTLRGSFGRSSRWRWRSSHWCPTCRR